MEDNLKKCFFLPKSVMIKVMELLEAPVNTDPIKIYCKRNLLKVQESRMIVKYQDSDIRSFKSVYRMAVCKAIYSQDWNKLLYLLKKCQPWVHKFKASSEAALYVRALVVLLMFHPSSQAKGLLKDYLHLVWSCRDDETKKAVFKIVLTLPKKIQGVTYGRYCESNKE